jgi:hypothetical protein
VIFLDGDDVWEPDALETLSAALDAAPECVAAHGHTHSIDADGRLVVPDPWEKWKSRVGISGNQVIDWPLDKPTTFAVLIVGGTIRTSGTVLIRRRVLDAAGYYEPGLTGYEDWHVWLRISSQGPIAFVNRSVLAYRMHSANASHDYSMMARAASEVRWRILDFPKLSDEQRRMARFALLRSYQRDIGFWWQWAKDAAADRRVSAVGVGLRRSLACLAKLYVSRARLHLMTLSQNPMSRLSATMS